MTWPANLSGSVRHNQWQEDCGEIKRRGNDYSKTWRLHAIVAVVQRMEVQGKWIDVSYVVGWKEGELDRTTLPSVPYNPAMNS